MNFLLTGVFVILANLSLIFLKNIFLTSLFVILAGTFFIRSVK